VKLLWDSVRAQLLAVRGDSDAEKRACLKRLLFQWHPDRNLENIEVSTAVFQYLQQEKSTLLGLS